MRKLRGLLFLGMVISNLAYGLDKLPLDSFPARSPQRALQAILYDPRLETCRQDLQHFVGGLSSKDLQEIKKQKDNFDGEKLKKILTAKVDKALPKSIEIDDFMKGVSILIPHGKMNCQISIYPELDIDQLKANVDPTHEDLQIKDGAGGTFDVQATLVGVSADAAEGSAIHFDPSKAMTIIRQQGIEDLNEQIRLLGEFEKNQTSSSKTSEKIPKPTQ
jgi:cytochrome c556